MKRINLSPESLQQITELAGKVHQDITKGNVHIDAIRKAFNGISYADFDDPDKGWNVDQNNPDNRREEVTCTKSWNRDFITSRIEGLQDTLKNTPPSALLIEEGLKMIQLWAPLHVKRGRSGLDWNLKALQYYVDCYNRITSAEEIFPTKEELKQHVDAMREISARLPDYGLEAQDLRNSIVTFLISDQSKRNLGEIADNLLATAIEGGKNISALSQILYKPGLPPNGAKAHQDVQDERGHTIIEPRSHLSHMWRNNLLPMVAAAENIKRILSDSDDQGMTTGTRENADAVNFYLDTLLSG